MTQRIIGLVALIGAVFLTACGGGGGGGGGGTTPTWTVTYAAPPNTSPGNIVLRLSSGSTNVRPSFDVVVYGPVSAAYNIAFHLSYNASILRYRSASEGTTLNATCCATGCVPGGCFLVDSGTPDKLIVGLTRLESGVGVDLPESAPYVLMTLTFDTVGTGSFVFEYAPASQRELKNPDGVELSTGWYGGQVTVSRS